MKNWTEIWREIAEAFETPFKKRNARQLYITAYHFCNEWDRFGICDALRRFYKKPISPADVSFFMEQISGHRSFRFWFPTTDYQDKKRALFCYFMAAMGDEGFEDFLTWCKEN